MELKSSFPAETEVNMWRWHSKLRSESSLFSQSRLDDTKELTAPPFGSEIRMSTQKTQQIYTTYRVTMKLAKHKILPCQWKVLHYTGKISVLDVIPESLSTSTLIPDLASAVDVHLCIVQLYLSVDGKDLSFKMISLDCSRWNFAMDSWGRRYSFLIFYL